MKDLFINRWEDSFRESFAFNGEHSKETGFFSFEITPDQKEYLEDHHARPVDDMCADEVFFGKAPHTIKFEEFNDGTEEGAYTCDCYF